MSQKDGIVHLWDLPEDTGFIKLPNAMQKEMIDNALRFFKNEKDLAKKLGSNQSTVNSFRNSKLKSTNLKFVKRLASVLCERGLNQFSMGNLEKIITLVKTQVGYGIKNPKFPLNFNCVEGTKIVSAMFWDGGIRKSLVPFYVNNEETLLNSLIDNVTKTIGKVHYSIYFQRKKVKTSFIDFTKILGVILTKVGVPVGKKVLSNPLIPDFVLNGSNDVKRAFIQQAFDDEGTVNIGQKSRGKRIQLEQHNVANKPSIRLLQLKELVQQFGINVSEPYLTCINHTKQGYTGYGWKIEITNQRDLRNFAENINFSVEKKCSSLFSLLNSYVMPPYFKRGEIFEMVTSVCKQMKSENIKLTNRNIAKKLNLSESYVKQLTRELVNKNKFKVVKRSTSLGGRIGFLPSEFDFLLDN